MYKSYFITAIRSMTKNKMHAMLNILGLSVGVTVAIVVTLWVSDEISHEKNFANYERIGRVIQNVTNNGEVQTWTNTPWPLADELRKNYSADFSHIAVSTWDDDTQIQADSIKFIKPGVFAEPGLARMLELKMIYGSIDVVDDPSSILLSKSTAVALFGDTDPIGKQLTLINLIEMKVGGVYEDIPANSDFTEVGFFAPWALYYERSGVKEMDDPWRPNAFATYVMLNDNATFADASERIRDAKMKKINEALQKKKPELFVHPMSEWHLKAEFENGKQTSGRMQYVILFSIVGVFVVFMACINFMNLSTAQSEKRAKEVGIRKAIGSLRAQLVSQFLSESILTVFISLFVALVLTVITLPFFNLISQKNMALPWSNVTWWVGGVAFTLLIGFIAGSYPALYLSSMGLGRAKKSNQSPILRKSLVTIQFTVSVVLMIGTAVVYLQIQHAKNRPLGYNSNGLVRASSSKGIHDHLDVIRKELKDNGAIVEIAEAGSSVTSGYSSSSRFDWNGKDPNLSVDFGVNTASAEYGSTIGWTVIKGRDFSRDRVTDSSAMILNRAAADYMGLKDPIGEIVRWAGDPYEIIGVVDNMIVRSPYGEPPPSIYVQSRDELYVILFRLNPGKPAAESLAIIESVIKKHNPEQPFDYEFTDVAYARKFGDEERVGTLATTIACLAVFISCLGIFGLSSFNAEQRTKEIGVRKVLGATTYDLWRMMSKDFVLLVMISCLIAVPIAYVVLNSWLENFKYHTNVPVWTFFAATVTTLIITLVTVSWHTLNAAGANPVKSLKVE